MPPGQQFWCTDVERKRNPNHTFWRKECSYCDQKALWYRRNKTYCRLHKPKLMRLLEYDNLMADLRDAPYEEKRRAMDKYGKKHWYAASTSKFGGTNVPY